MASLGPFTCDLNVGTMWSDYSNLFDGDTGTYAYSNNDDETIIARWNTNPFSGIPDTATIDGILVNIYCYSGDGDDRVDAAIYNATDIAWTSDELGTGSDTPSDDPYGGSTPLFGWWGTIWTVSDVKNAGFGVRLNHQAVTKAAPVYASRVNVTVYYTLAATPHTIEKTSDTRFLKEQSASKTSDIRFLKEQSINKASDCKYIVVGDIDKSSNIRFFKEQSVDKYSDVRFLKEQTIEKNSLARYIGGATLTKYSNVRFASDATIDKTSIIRFLVENQTDKYSSIRFLSDSTIGKNSNIRFIDDTTIIKLANTRYKGPSAISKSSLIRYVPGGGAGGPKIPPAGRRDGWRL